MTWFRCVGAPTLLVALLVGVTCLEPPPAAAQKKKAKKKKGKGAADSPAKEVGEGDPRLKQVRGDLEAIFRHWDTDKDNKVTAVELAVGFRGRESQPYRPVSPGDAPPKPGTREMKLPEIAKKYPDYNFLLHWDKDRDDAVTSKEYDAFVDEVTAHFKVIFQKQDEIDQLNKELAVKDINASRKARITAQLKVLDTQLSAAHLGFRHQLSLDSMAKRASLRRADWLWYKTAPVPRRR